MKNLLKRFVIWAENKLEVIVPWLAEKLNVTDNTACAIVSGALVMTMVLIIAPIVFIFSPIDAIIMVLVTPFSCLLAILCSIIFD